MKICTKCNKELSKLNFRFRNDCKRYVTICKKCESLYNKQYYRKNPKKANESCKKWKLKHLKYNKQYYLKNKIEIKNKCKLWYSNNKNKVKKTKRKHYLNNKEKVLRQNQLWKIKNKEKSKLISYKYYLKNKEKILKNNKKWRLSNKDLCKLYYLKRDKKEKSLYSKKWRLKNKEKANKKYLEWAKKTGKPLWRHSYKYKKWKLNVYKQNNYICKLCCKTNCKLNAHHIKSAKDFPELRYDITNGICLCVKCHKDIHHKNRLNQIPHDLRL